jgi:hypothetical protein
LQFGHKERLFQFVCDALAYGNPDGRYKGHAQKCEQTYTPPESDAIDNKHLYQGEKGNCGKQDSFVHNSKVKYTKMYNVSNKAPVIKQGRLRKRVRNRRFQHLKRRTSGH